MKKQKAISDSHYFDGRSKCWKTENIKDYPIARPSKALVEKWLTNWDKTEGYPEQEQALDKLFFDLVPHNTDLNDILIKACTLNDFYSTNIYKIINVAKIIKEMDVDSILVGNEPHPEIVDVLNEKVFKETGRHIYSFASKYFSHHKPDLYPIYDSYVDKLLRYYRDTDEFYAFTDDHLQQYKGFCDVIDHFKAYYGLQEYTVKDIDKMLWQMGKKHFPKYI